MSNEIRFDELKYRREAEEFREVRARLQAAMNSVEVPRDLETRVRLSLAQTQARPASNWNRRLMSIAAGIAIVIGGWLSVQVGNLRVVTEERQNYVLAISRKVATIMRVGLAQHIHCAVFREKGKPPDPREDMDLWLAEYKELLPVVRKQVPSNFELLTAHKCKYHGREFVHFQFEDHGKLLSLLIVNKRDGESFTVEGLAPALVESGLPMYSAGVQSFQMTAFETVNHLAYVVSNLPAQQNLQIASALGPAVKQLLARIGG